MLKIVYIWLCCYSRIRSWGPGWGGAIILLILALLIALVNWQMYTGPSSRSILMPRQGLKKAQQVCCVILAAFAHMRLLFPLKLESSPVWHSSWLQQNHSFYFIFKKESANTLIRLSYSINSDQSSQPEENEGISNFISKKLYYTITTPLLPPTVSNLHLAPYRHQTNRCTILDNTALVEMLIVFPMGAEGT